MNVLLQVVSDLHVLLKTVVTLESLGKIIPLIFRNNVQKEGVKRKKRSLVICGSFRLHSEQQTLAH